MARKQKEVPTLELNHRDLQLLATATRDFCHNNAETSKKSKLYKEYEVLNKKLEDYLCT